MKTRNLLKISVLSAFLLLCGQLFSQIQTFEWQGTQRQYLIKIPENHSETMPILYFLHGLGDNITRLDNEFHFQQVADEFQWTVVIPQALSQSGATMWNAGLMASSIDDSGFLMALLDALAEQYPINLDSVFFTGFSMGGFMTHRMAIEHGDRITACAPVSGLITHTMASYTAVAPVRMLHIHGTSDPVVGYDGNSQYFGGNLGLSVEAILNYWKNANHCTGEPTIDTLPDLHNDGLRFVRYTYDCGTDLQHLKVIGGNHTWYLNENQYDIAYFTEITRFFKGDPTPTNVAHHPETTSLKVYPNPAWGLFNIEVEETTRVQVIDVLGKVVMEERLTPGIHQVDSRAWPEGVYFVRGEGVYSKVVVSR